MARNTTTTYTCDGCGYEVERRQLRRIAVESNSMAGSDWRHAGRHELCIACRTTLAHVLQKKYGFDEAPVLEAFKLDQHTPGEPAINDPVTL